MPAAETESRIAEYLSAHNKMTLATVTPDGRPLAHTVEYASDGPVVFFATLRTTRKAQNIIKTQSVAYAVDEDYSDWMQIRGVQMEGRAEIVKDQPDLKKAMEIYLKKFPAAAQIPPNPDMIFIKITPVAGFFLDYTKGFAHRDEFVYSRCGV